MYKRYMAAKGVKFNFCIALPMKGILTRLLPAGKNAMNLSEGMKKNRHAVLGSKECTLVSEAATLNKDAPCRNYCDEIVRKNEHQQVHGALQQSMSGFVFLRKAVQTRLTADQKCCKAAETSRGNKICLMYAGPSGACEARQKV